MTFVVLLPLFRDPATVTALELAEQGEEPSAAPSAVASSPPGASARSAAPASSGSAPAKPVPPPPEEVAPSAELDLAATAADLEKLAAKFPKDPRVTAKLAKTLSTTPNGLHGALSAARRTFELSPSTTESTDLQTIVKRGASGQPATSDLALDIMATSMGPVGPDLLFELSNAKSVSPTVRKKAVQATQTEAVKKLATPALRVAVGLRDRGGCQRAELFEEAEKVGDARSLQYLTPLQARSGCGPLFFKMNDCYECLGNRATLQKAIQAIQKRAGAKKP